MRLDARTSASLKMLPWSSFQLRILNMAGVTPCTWLFRFSLPALSLKLPCSAGAAPTRLGRSLSAAASWIDSEGTAPARARWAVVRSPPGNTYSMLVPSCCSSLPMKRCMLSPIASSRTTDAMPITMPSMVRAVRRRLAAIERKDSINTWMKFMPSPRVYPCARRSAGAGPRPPGRRTARGRPSGAPGGGCRRRRRPRG